MPVAVTLCPRPRPALPVKLTLLPMRDPAVFRTPPLEAKVKSAVPVLMLCAGNVSVPPAMMLTNLLVPLVIEVIARLLVSRRLIAPPVAVTPPVKSLLT